jgi:hypothetical protein
MNYNRRQATHDGGAIPDDIGNREKREEANALKRATKRKGGKSEERDW